MASFLTREVTLVDAYGIAVVLQLCALMTYFGTMSTPLLEMCILAIMAFFLSCYAVDCVRLTFDGQRRVDRYAISQQHPLRNGVLNILGVASPFLVVVVGPIAALYSNIVIGYSHFVSPDRDANGVIFIDQHRKYWAKAFLVALNTALMVAIVKMFNIELYILPI